MGIVAILKNVREFFWPLLEPLEETNIRQITIDDCKFLDDEIDFELKYLEDNRKSEEDRKKEVESKATIFVGTFAVATTVLINMAKEFIFSPVLELQSLNYFVVFFIALTIIYLCRAIQFAIRTLQRRKYNTLGFPDFLLTEDRDKKKQILVRQYNAIKKNQKEINIKVDYMTMAQAYFQRAVMTVLLLTIMFLCTFIFLNKSVINNIVNIIKEVVTNQTALVLVIGIAIFFFSIIIFLFYKLYSLEKRIDRTDHT